MQDIRDLSSDDLTARLKEKNSWIGCGILSKSQRKISEKRLFLLLQERSPPPIPKKNIEQNEYFLLDLTLPQNWLPGISILKKKASEKNRKTVRFKQTEVFGDVSIYPYCIEKYGHDTKNNHLHAPQCPNSTAETIEVLGEHRWLNRLFLIDGRYGI